MARKEDKKMLYIGKANNGEHIFIEDAFEYDDWTKWLTWFSLEFHTEYEEEQAYEDFCNSDDWYYCYIEYLRANKPRDVSYDDWTDMLKDDWYSPYDDSFRWKDCTTKAMEYAGEKDENDCDYYQATNCISCGRIFRDEMLKKDFWEYVIPENFAEFKKLYKQYEQGKE